MARLFRNQSQRGQSLIEMMLWLSLLGVFIFVSLKKVFIPAGRILHSHEALLRNRSRSNPMHSAGLNLSQMITKTELLKAELILNLQHVGKTLRADPSVEK